jgi:Tetratricopeptide repeat
MRDPLPAMTGYGMTLGSVLPRGTAGSARQANWLAGPSAVNVSADRGCYVSVRGHDPVPPVAARGNLASVYREAGRTAEAIPLLEQNLADRERVLGSDHPYTLAIRNKLTSAYQVAGHTAATDP